MGFTSRIFLWLAATALVNDAGCTFNRRPIPTTDQERLSVKFINNCPPIGSQDDKFNVYVSGSVNPTVTGCAWMQPRTLEYIPAFELWLGLGNVPEVGEGCTNAISNMEHLVFECLSKHPAYEDHLLNGWSYTMLYNVMDRTEFYGPRDYNCALYGVMNENPILIKMIISGNRACNDLAQKLNSSKNLPPGARYDQDGYLDLLFSSEAIVGTKQKRSVKEDMKKPSVEEDKEKPSEEEDKENPSDEEIITKKRTVQSSGCRFPDWSQGSWIDLQVDESLVQYDSAFHKTDEFVDTQENDDGNDGDAETAGGVQYTKISKRSIINADETIRYLKLIDNQSYSNAFDIANSKDQPTQNFTKEGWIDIYSLAKRMDFIGPNFGGRWRRSVLPKEQRTTIDIVTRWVIEMEDPKLRKLWHRPATAKSLNETSVNSANINDEFKEYIRFKNPHGNGEEGTPDQKKNCSWPMTETTTQLYKDVEFESPQEKAAGIVKNGRIIYRKKRASDEDHDDDDDDDDTLDDEEAVLEKVGFLEEINRLVRWWNIMRVRLATEYLNTGKTNTFKLNQVMEMPAIPTPEKFLKYAASQCVSYKVALITWRSLERTHRKFEATVNYTANPGNRHPDIVLKDFDRTFKDIEYDFNPLYPEGTVDDPTAYRVVTLPNGKQEGPRDTRRLTWVRKKARAAALESASTVRDNPEHSTTHENIKNIIKRIRRNSPEENQKQRASTKFTWRCEMAVEEDKKPLQDDEIGAKFLTYGGRIVEKNVLPGNERYVQDHLVDIEDNESKTYGCMWLVPRGPNIIEFSIIGTGMPEPDQDINIFAQQLCAENKATGSDVDVRKKKKLQPRRHWWITETRPDESQRVPVGCPVIPGIVYYGVIPAPPPALTVPAGNFMPASRPLCARLVSSYDYCMNGNPGPSDQMMYTVSECVKPGTSLAIPPKTTFQEREYQCLGQWTEPQTHISPMMGQKQVMLTYTYLRRVSPLREGGPEYECFVGTTIPNDNGVGANTTNTLLLTEAGTGTKCSRLSDPFNSGIKLVGTKIYKKGHWYNDAKHCERLAKAAANSGGIRVSNKKTTFILLAAFLLARQFYRARH